MTKDEAIRDVWLRVLRGASKLGEELMRDTDGDSPMIFSVFPADGAIKSYLAYCEDETQMVDALVFVGLVGIAVNAIGVALVARTTKIVLQKSDAERDAEFRDRCLGARSLGPEAGVPALSATALYRDSSGARKVIGMARVIANSADGTVAFEKPEFTDGDSTLFGGMTELLPGQRPSALLQVAAAEWLMRWAGGEMERLGIHSVETPLPEARREVPDAL